MKKIFHTVLTTERHKKHGYCEAQDFGSLELIQLEPEEKKLIVSYDDNENHIEMIEHNGKAYVKITNNSLFIGFSKEEDKEIASKQGKYSPNTALKFILEMRERLDNSYSHASEESYILIGRSLYAEFCKKRELSITVCGNLLFSYWLSIDIEAKHGGKKNYKFSKESFEKVFRTEKKRFDEGKPKNKKGDGHVSFSYPKNIKWG
jgi:hypothetical protein